MSPTPSKPIRFLEPAVAEKIAAGEVVERPASVVKELVENSLDAGATQILIELQDGGRESIVVTDNGAGIAEDELTIAVKRHATSKISTFDDLDRLSTLGFRGEALPSIAAVADLSILSRAVVATSMRHGGAAELFARGTGETVGPATFGHFLGSEHGTRVKVESLFSQVPARLKFLKSPAAEVTAVREWLERLAMTRPDVGFKLVSGDRTVVELRPETRETRTRKILADGSDAPVATHRSEDHSPLIVTASWIQGMSLPTTRRLVQVVNGRAVRDRTIQQAMLNPFRQLLLPGQFPALAVWLEIPGHLVDVNAHPAKTEIRFSPSSQVFRAVQACVESLIGKEGAASFVAAQPVAPAGPSTAASLSVERTPPLMFWSAADTRSGNPAAFSLDPAGSATLAHAAPTGTPTRPAISVLDGTRYVGSVLNTYLIFERGGGEEIMLVDQHAAHERIRYEKLLARLDRAGESQALLVPEVVTIDPLSREKIENRLDWLRNLGFEAEIFGDQSVIFRALPAEWGTHLAQPRLRSLVERLLESDTGQEGETLERAPGAVNGASASIARMDSYLFEKLASEACHSAVRAGDRIEPQEALALGRDLFFCANPWNCPHGRPTLVRVPRARFEEWFQRRI